jgi:hypothetical protein
MTTTNRKHPAETLSIDPGAAHALTEHSVVRDVDRSHHPHLLVKVPDLADAAQADVGVEIEREDDGCVTLSVLLYDIPTEPVSYDLRLYPDQPEDLRFLWSFVETAQFRLHPCHQANDGWEVGPSQTFRLPPNVLLRLKHYSLSWPRREEAEVPTAPPTPPTEPAQVSQARTTDPRDTVIGKLKQQVQALRDQIQERDRRIIELEDELHELKSRGRSYRLSGDRKPWWKPFS